MANSVLSQAFLIGIAAACPLFAANLGVTDDGASLLATCGDESSAIQELEPGTTVSLRFSIAGAATTCHSVTVDVDGRKLSGYVAKESLAGLDELDQQRRTSSRVGSSRGLSSSVLPVAPAQIELPVADIAGYSAALQSAAEALRDDDPNRALTLVRESGVPATDRNAAVISAQASLKLTRPQDALTALEHALVENPNDAVLLGLAGMASFQRDRGPEALRYLKRSLELQPNPSFDSLRQRIEHELNTDQASETAYGMRLALRYEGAALPDTAARKLAQKFEMQINKVVFQLGCKFNDRINVIVRTQENYQQATLAAEWSGGLYDGRIHIAVPPSGEADQYVLQTFTHEFVHACLARRGPWPSWFHEGMAQKVSGRTLTSQARDSLAQLNRADGLPTLEQLSGGWARLGTQQASIAYALALAAAQVLYQDLQDYGVRNLLSHPDRLDAAAVRVDARLRETLR
jgi:tetratricopeptide (TPR) repeat protein